MPLIRSITKPEAFDAAALTMHICMADQKLGEHRRAVLDAVQYALNSLVSTGVLSTGEPEAPTEPEIVDVRIGEVVSDAEMKRRAEMREATRRACWEAGAVWLEPKQTTKLMSVAEAIESDDARIRLQGWMWIMADIEEPCKEIASAESATRGRVMLTNKLLYHLLGQALLA